VRGICSAGVAGPAPRLSKWLVCSIFKYRQEIAVVQGNAMDQFFIGLHHPSDAWPFLRSMISVNAIRDRKGPFKVNDWIMDSGAFTEISTYGRWRTTPEEYAEQINRWMRNGNMLAAVSQDLMCAPFILGKSGLTVQAHQEVTIERYLRLTKLTDAYVMPVLQGDSPETYAAHVSQYGSLIKRGQWVGVGSVCMYNGNPDRIEDVLLAIKAQRSDLCLHGFGLKVQALKRPTVRALLYSSDSMAWSYAGRKNGGSEHDPRLALTYAAKVEEIISRPMFVQQQLYTWWQGMDSKP
jgi:hypothetical protein